MRNFEHTIFSPFLLLALLCTFFIDRGNTEEIPDSLLSCFSPPKDFDGKFGDFRNPLLFNDGSLVKTAEDWARRRNEILDQWTALLGKWPALLTEPKVDILESISLDGGLTRQRIRFLWMPEEETTGYLFIPMSKQSPHPAVLTVFYEPATAAGLSDKENRDFALRLARRGFVTLSIGADASFWPTRKSVEMQPLSMAAYAAANAWQVLASRSDVDPDRIGIMGHSYGGKWALFASCLFDRFACAVWSDPGIVFDTRGNVNYWEPWYLGYHPQPWRKAGVPTPENPARGLYPKLITEGRDLHELHTLMAPRPFLVSGGAEDSPSRWPALNHSIAVNRVLGYENRVAMHNRPAHSPTAESNEIAYQFFEHFLRP